MSQQAVKAHRTLVGFLAFPIVVCAVLSDQPARVVAVQLSAQQDSADFHFMNFATPSTLGYINDTIQSVEAKANESRQRATAETLLPYNSACRGTFSTGSG